MDVFDQKIREKQPVNHQIKEKMWENIFEQSRLGFGLCDKELKYILINKALAAMNGLPVEAHIGKHIRAVLPAISDEVVTLMQEVLATGKPFIGHEISNRAINRIDDIRAWSFSFYPYIVENKIEGVWASCEDITAKKQIEAERQRAEQELRYREARFNRLISATATTFWNADANGEIIDDVPMWEELTGQSVAEMQNLGWGAVIYPDDVEGTKDKWLAAVRTKEQYEVEFRLRMKNGEYRWFLSRALPMFNEDGTIREWIGVNVDIENQKQADRQLQEAAIEREELLRREQQARAEAEQANRLKDEFLATVSHELRTPLTATLGWVKMLRAGQLEAEDTAHALETIERNTNVQKKLIEDLLDVSRIITGKLRLDVRSMKLETVLRSAINTVLPTAEMKEIFISEEIQPNIGAVYGDPHRLQQIIWNLLSNAIKFTPQGGHIIVRLREINNLIEVAIEDNGIGIKPELLARIFDRFRQAESMTTRRHGGLGLGLAIVRHLVEAHGGIVEAQSAGVGAGATFIFRLPVINVAPAEMKEKNQITELPNLKLAKNSRLDGLRLLVVDDDPDNLDLLKLLLSRYGATVTVAGSAADGMRCLTKQPPDILISDIGMPVEDGYQLMCKIRALPKKSGGGIPAIALTAFAKAEDREKALSVGFQRHITKPVDPTDLVKAIAELASTKIAE